jgi:KDO2-lipid IV(A) lauroyltransferase
MGHERDVSERASRAGEAEERRPSRPRRVGDSQPGVGARLLLSLVAALAGRLPAAAAAWVGRRAGDAGFLVLRRRRRIALDNLAIAFPALSPAARRRLGRRSWQHLGLTVMEMCRLVARPVEATLEGIAVEGLHHLARAMEVHKRVILVSAHLGNWELLALVGRLVGHPIAIVVRPLDARWLRPLAEMMRRRTGTELIDKRGALRGVLEALRRGYIAGVLLDQNASRREGVFVPFFGRPASTARSVGLLAVRTGTPVVPLFIRRIGFGRHQLSIRPPVAPPSPAEPETAVRELTARCTEVIEAAVRDAPDQWLWMHQRWRTRPVPPE